MFGFHEDLDLGMIRAQVALTAGLRLSRLHNGETMTGMAARAAPLTPVEVDPADAYIRPGFRIQFSVFYL